MKATERHNDLVRRFVEAGNARDYSALRALLAPDFTRHCPATPNVVVRNLEEFLRFQEQDAAACPDNRVTIDTLVAEGDAVAFWATYTGTQHGPLGPFPPSGRRMSIEFAGQFRIVNNRIAELRLTWDNLGALVQLGHLSLPG